MFSIGKEVSVVVDRKVVFYSWICGLRGKDRIRIRGVLFGYKLVGEGVNVCK